MEKSDQDILQKFTFRIPQKKEGHTHLKRAMFRMRRRKTHVLSYGAAVNDSFKMYQKHMSSNVFY